MFERPVRESAAKAALEIVELPGAPALIDSVAEQADPRHAFLRRAWFEATGEKLTSLIASRPDGRPIVALPTYPARPCLRAVPGSYWPFRSFPIAAEASDAELIGFLAAPAVRRALGPIWRLGPVLADDPTFVRLAANAQAGGWSMLRRHAGTSYSLDMAAERKAGPWPRPSTLKNMAKHEKRLSKHGPIGWRHVSGPSWTEAAIEDLVRIERGSWVGSRSGADPKFLDPARRRAWERMLADPAMAEMLTAGILLVDGAPVSFSFGIDAGPVRYSIATSYDESYARYSPGYLTGYRTYGDAADRGVAVLNLGVGDGGAKGSMGAEPRPEMVDCLFVRSAIWAALLAPIWRRSGKAR